MKLHIGSGSVYLSGWHNIDVRGPNTYLARDRPDLVEKWKTTDDAYYAKHQDKTIGKLRAGPLDQDYVCDAYGDFANIPAPYWEADEVLARHSFEHLSITEAHKALDQIDGIMKPNGILRLDVPDHEETLQKFKQTGDDFYIRHLLGPRRNDYGFHMMSYDRQRLRALVEEHGFVWEGEERNIHFYPAFCLRFRKPGPRAPHEYLALPLIPDNWKVAEVGPGEFPWKRADVYIDYDISKLTPLSARGKSTILGDVQGGLSQIPDKEYDLIYCSHVMEHLSSPTTAAATLSRIGKAGVLVMPSAWKEALTNFEESGHLWSVLDNPACGKAPIFVRATAERLDRMRNVEVMKSLSRAFRTGPNGRVCDDQRLLRTWWYHTEPALDVFYHWENVCELKVVE